MIDPVAILVELRLGGRIADRLSRHIVGLDLGARRQIGRPHVDELELACFPDQRQGLRFVLQPRQLDDDAARALQLHERLGHAEAVDTILDDLARSLHGGRIDLRVSGKIRFEQYLDPSLQVESLADLNGSIDAEEANVDPRIAWQGDPRGKAAQEQDDCQYRKGTLSHR